MPRKYRYDSNLSHCSQLIDSIGFPETWVKITPVKNLDVAKMRNTMAIVLRDRGLEYSMQIQGGELFYYRPKVGA